MKKLINFIGQSGMSDSYSNDERSKVYHLNLGVVCGALLFIPAALFEASYGYSIVNILNGSFILSSIVSFFLNRFFGYSVSKNFMIVSLDLILLAANYFEGLQTGNYLIYFSILLLLPIFIKVKDGIWEFAFVVSITIACVLASILFCSNKGYYNLMTTKTAHVFYYISFLLAFLTTGLFAAIIFDISNKKEKDLLAAKVLAEENAKAKMQFLSNMSHELRTPLNGILGVANLLIDETVHPKQREKLDMLHYSANHMLNVVNDILDYSKITAGQFTLHTATFNFRDFLQTVYNSFIYQFNEKNVTLRLDIDVKEAEVFVIGDELRLGQILNNLLANALKFTSKGEVILRASIVNHEEEVFIYLAVSDTGIGIKPEYLESIFEMFSQADYSSNKKYGGTGLGLSISKQLVASFDSEIKVQSELGAGSTFSFDLVLPKGKESAIRRHVFEMVNDFKQKRVLVAEDNPVNLAIATKFLENWNLQVTAAIDGIETLEVFQRNSFDAILLDLGMPRMDGYEAVREIRAIDPNIPIIAFTAAILDKELLSKGFTDFVFKPFQPAAFNQVLARYLR